MFATIAPCGNSFIVSAFRKPVVCGVAGHASIRNCDTWSSDSGDPW